MNKKWVFIVIGILLFIGIIGIIGAVGIGGKVFMDKKQAEKEQRQEAERMSVVALKNTFEGIKSVEFEKSGYNKMTGSYRMFVEMTNQNNETVSFSYSFWKKREEVGSYILKSEQVQIEGVTSNKVKTTYSNGKKGEI